MNRYDPSRYAIPSSGDPEQDRREIDSFIKHSMLIDEGMCPNGCGPLSEGEYEGSTCAVCGFWCNRLWKPQP